ncbi:hypothetical protein Hdeb2414_s0008g00281461 [Helianthus debilis subsp. tardiflorus]
MFEPSYAVARMLMALQTINRPVSLFCFYTGIYKIYIPTMSTRIYSYTQTNT